MKNKREQTTNQNQTVYSICQVSGKQRMRIIYMIFNKHGGNILLAKD